MNLFDMGGLTLTCGVRDLMDRHGVEFTDKMLDCVRRHLSGDWGDICDEDKELNNEALRLEQLGEESERLFSMYETEYCTLYVITEWDKSMTTVLLPEEY